MNLIISKCTTRMGLNDIPSIEDLIHICKIDSISELSVSIPMQFQVAGIIGIIRFAPFVANFVNPGLCYKFLSLMQEKISSRHYTKFHVIKREGKYDFFRDTKTVYAIGTIVALSALAVYF